MAHRTNDRDQLSFLISALSDTEVTDLLEYISDMKTTRTSQRVTEGHDEDVISLLADARENRRARIVHEWDTIRRRAEDRNAPGARARI